MKDGDEVSDKGSYEGCCDEVCGESGDDEDEVGDYDGGGDDVGYEDGERLILCLRGFDDRQTNRPTLVVVELLLRLIKEGTRVPKCPSVELKTIDFHIVLISFESNEIYLISAPCLFLI